MAQWHCSRLQTGHASTAAVGVPTPEPMAVIDRHMEAIKVVYPSEYNAIVAKVRSLHEAT